MRHQRASLIGAIQIAPRSEAAMTDEPENPEVFIREGGVWIPDGKALCDKIGASYLYFDEGELYAGVSG
jgi:hypothetical protein